VVFFAYKTVSVARDTLREARREQRLARLERMRTLVGEIERLHRWQAVPEEMERSKDRLAMLLRSAGGHERLPETAKLAHWAPSFDGAEDVMESARLELDRAIVDASFEQD
jgi:hypothetical protein